MNRKITAFLLAGMMTALAIGPAASAKVLKKTGEQQTESAKDTQAVIEKLEDGIYSAQFSTDSSMFHVNEACDGKGVLTVKDGEMTLHISMPSKSIVNLYPGLADEAKAEGAQLLEPTLDTVTYRDGFSEEVYGFDIPVPVLQEEFDVALIGTHGNWYDHKVKVTSPELMDESETDVSADGESGSEEERASSDEGQVYVALSGGSGRAGIASPAVLAKKDGQYVATITWSSIYYDYMIVDGEKYLNEAAEGNSVFTIPVLAFDEPIPVIADTTAMSTPHEIEYELTFSMNDSFESETTGQDSADEEPENSGNAQAVPTDGGAETAEVVTEAEVDGAAVDTEKTDAAENGSVSAANVQDQMQLHYADQFAVSYEDGLTHITIGDDQQYLIIPDGMDAPENIPGNVTVLQGFPERTYLVSSSAMDLVRAADSLDHVRFCGTKENDWYIEEAVQAMQAGDLLYAGKYSAPDYELLIAGECDLAIENTMISHNPQVQEKLETLGIPVMVERSSYESHPLGRLEWVRFYGALFGQSEAADTYYEEQLEKIQPVMEQESIGTSVAFFSINSSGAATIRKPGDYITRSIELAGGRYVFENIAGEADNALSTMNMQLEDFYAGAREADVLIYNGTIEGELETITDLLEKSPLFADFAAVKNGYVLCASRDLFQQTTGTAEFILDLNKVCQAAQNGDDIRDLALTYLRVME